MGVDLGTPFGTPITSLYNGIVTDASYQPWGGQVGIETNIPGKGNLVWYVQHLDTIATGIVKGAQVSAGELLGSSGGQLSGGSHPTTSQYSSGAHIETGFDAPWVSGSSGKPSFDPASILSQIQGTGGTGGGIPDLGSLAGQVSSGVQQVVFPQWFTNIGDTVSALQKPDTQIRVGLVAVGAVIVIFGLIRLVA